MPKLQAPEALCRNVSLANPAYDSADPNSTLPQENSRSVCAKVHCDSLRFVRHMRFMRHMRCVCCMLCMHFVRYIRHMRFVPFMRTPEVTSSNSEEEFVEQKID